MLKAGRTNHSILNRTTLNIAKLYFAASGPSLPGSTPAASGSGSLLHRGSIAGGAIRRSLVNCRHPARYGVRPYAFMGHAPFYAELPAGTPNAGMLSGRPDSCNPAHKRDIARRATSMPVRIFLRRRLLGGMVRSDDDRPPRKLTAPQLARLLRPPHHSAITAHITYGAGGMVPAGLGGIGRIAWLAPPRPLADRVGG
jgi:hypothetical protein